MVKSPVALVFPIRLAPRLTSPEKSALFVLSIVNTVEVELSSIPVDVKLVILSPAVIAMSVPPVVFPIASISAKVSCPSTAAST